MCVCVWVTKSIAHHFKTVPTKFHQMLYMASRLFKLALHIALVVRCIRVWPWSNVMTYMNICPEGRPFLLVAHQQLPRNFAISFEDRFAQPRPRTSETKASRGLRIVRLEASNIGGKQARDVKSAHMKNFQAAIY